MARSVGRKTCWKMTYGTHTCPKGPDLREAVMGTEKQGGGRHTDSIKESKAKMYIFA